MLWLSGIEKAGNCKEVDISCDLNGFLLNSV